MSKMKKILVPIDFSANSKKAARFAIQFASQTNAELLFFHVVRLMTPTTDGVWEYAYTAQFQDDELKRSQNHLLQLIKKIYSNKDQPSGTSYKCICKFGSSVGNEIISYAKKQKADFICVGASGSGVMAKLFGTVSTQLMVESPMPVFVIPKNYRLKPLVNICYASDMVTPEPEIKKLLTLATSLHAAVNVVHFDYEIGLKENKERLTKIAQKYKTRNIHFKYKKLNALYPLNDHLRKVITLIKPSLLVLFTKQNRNWFDRLILSSNSAELSFSVKVPLLVFKKTNKMTATGNIIYRKLYNQKNQ